MTFLRPEAPHELNYEFTTDIDLVIVAHASSHSSWGGYTRRETTAEIEPKGSLSKPR